MEVNDPGMIFSCALSFPAFGSRELVVNEHKSISFSPRSDDLGANGVSE